MNKRRLKVPVEQAIATSPCVGNCCLDLQDICLGCYRHIDEISGWHQADAEQRQRILARCDERAAQRLR